MKKDIENRGDIEQLSHRFFEQLLDRPAYSQLFFGVAQIKLGPFLHRFADFWESALFKAGKYDGDLMATHLEVDEMSRLDKAHFEEWLHLFFATVDQYFEGPKADELKEKAKALAIVMEMKINFRNQQRIKFGN
ncbi:MAG: group III truncated hemoglobin [Bacteroidota bacterium]